MSSALFTNLGPVIGLAYGLQAVSAIPSIYYKTDVYYDLSGSLTYIACTGFSLVLPAIRRAHAAGNPSSLWSILSTPGNFSGRQLLLSGLVSLWATRLGSFLFTRAKASGGDSRFEQIRQSPPKFLIAFLAQATWVALVSLPVFTVNCLLPHSPFHYRFPNTCDLIGLGLFLSGFTIEALADRQKLQWARDKQNKKHNEDFCARGLWSRSRHPNYFGEIVLWWGVAVIAAIGGGLGGHVGKKFIPGGPVVGTLMAAVSPMFTRFLLTEVSGIPIIEAKYNEKFGGKKEYENWKKNTPILWPKFL